MKLEYDLINGKEQTGLDESLYLFVGPKISELGTTIEGDEDNGTSFYRGYGKLNIPDTVTSIDRFAFCDCANFIGSLVIPNSVTSIGESAFQSCRGFTGSLTIPESVTEIGNAAFWDCSGFTTVVIHNSVTTIDTEAFKDCISLTSITCLRTTPPTLGSDVFSNTNNCPIYVPSGSVDEYKAASGWSDYAERIEAIPTT